MIIDETNEVLMNYYKKQEIIKAKKRIEEENMPIIKVLQLINKKFISTDELLDALYIDKEQVLEEISNTSSVPENTSNISINTANELGNRPIEIAKKYKEYYEKYKHDRKQICKDKKIANGTFQKYLRLNYLIPELQELVNNKKLAIVPAEHISFLDKNYQDIICYLIKQYNCEITAGVAKKIKEDYLLCKKNSKNYYLNESAIKNYKNERNVKVIFTKNEIEKYFKNVPKHNLKEYILNIVKETLDVWGTYYG